MVNEDNEMTVGIYDCVVNPDFRTAQGNIGVDNAFDLDWGKYFPKIKKHPSNVFLMISTEDCGILIHNNGNYTITKAKNDDVIHKYLEIIKDVVSNGRIDQQE